MLSVGTLFFILSYQKEEKVKSITSFQKCVEAGFPVLESYPPQCYTSDGRVFTQYIGNELDYKDEMLIEMPRPNQIIKSPQKITGRARGNWFFEAQTSGELYDEENRLLGTVIITANGDWMTTDFVPFSGELSYTTPQTEIGTLKIYNANPSGLPENQKELVIPVAFQ